MHLYKTVLFLLLFSTTFAQKQPPATPAKERLNGFETREVMKERSLVSNIPFRSVGPSVFGGRIVDLAVSPDDPTHFYAAYASGGLWKTTSNGATFDPIFEQEAVMTIGDIAVDWDNNIIWVGTGENNSSRSSYSGVGMYKSTDDGKTWSWMGLGESHHIGRIILHPSNPNILWVAALGHLYSPNEERGIYKTTDGGKTWEKILYINKNTGGVDLMIHPSNPDELYAAMWHRERRAWNFVESGEGSGIYKSTDGGNKWKKISTKAAGFPEGEGLGRIGIDIYHKGDKTILYSVVDNQARRPKEEKEEDKDALKKDDLRNMSTSDFIKLDKKKVNQFLKDNRFPKKYDYDKVISLINENKIQPKALVEYLEDANSLLFDTPVTGAEIYRSDDGGKSWSKTHTDYLDDIFYSYGYYFGQIRVAAHDPEQIYTMGVPVLGSKDGGKTWESMNMENVHVDHHALWVNPNRPGHLILGNDGGVNISYNNGESWFKCNTPAVGQFYTVNVDMAEPYNIYGGTQDNGVWMGPSTYKANRGWEQYGEYPYKGIMGGDGMQVAIDSRDNKTIYTGYQFGNYYRINTNTNEEKYISPKHELGERPLRFNWQTPIHLSVHNEDIFYIGSNKLHRSFNQGTDYEVISEDLTKGGRKGDVAYGTLTSIHESPIKFGLIYTGSDDGLVHITKDGGNTWTDISKRLPKDMWVTRVWASAHEEGRVYVSLNGYRWDDFNSYIYVSNNYGKNWNRIGNDLPAEPVNVIKEDPVNENVIYVGTDHGLYVSLDQGRSFMIFSEGLPATPFHDLVIHPRENDLVVGTHGRSIYVGNISLIQQLNDEILAKNIHLFEIGKTRYNSRWGSNWSKWLEPRVPKLSIPAFARSGGKATLQILTQDDLELKNWEADINRGINYLEYDLSFDKNVLEKYLSELNKEVKEDDAEIKIKEAKNGMYYLKPGTYKLKIDLNGGSETIEFDITE